MISFTSFSVLIIFQENAVLAFEEHEASTNPENAAPTFGENVAPTFRENAASTFRENEAPTNPENAALTIRENDVPTVQEEDTVSSLGHNPLEYSMTDDMTASTPAYEYYDCIADSYYIPLMNFLYEGDTMSAAVSYR